MTRGDGLAILLACACLGGVYAAFWSAPRPAAGVEIRVSGEDATYYSLLQDRRLELQGREGPVEIAIEQGEARFLHSSCRNQICVHSGWLRHAGDTAACLPNRISLRLTGDARYDAIAF